MHVTCIVATRHYVRTHSYNGSITRFCIIKVIDVMLHDATSLTPRTHHEMRDCKTGRITM